MNINNHKASIIRIALSIIGIVIVITTFCVLRNQNADCENVIKVGVILPLTGDLASEGEKAFCAVKLAEKEANDDLSKFKMKVFIEDGKFTAKDSLSAYNKLAIKGIDALLLFGDPPTEAIRPLATAQKIPTLAISGITNLPQSSEWIFRCLHSVGKIGEAVGECVSSSDISGRGGMLYVNTTGGKDFYYGFKSKYQGELMADSFDFNVRDARSSIIKMTAHRPQWICVFGYGDGYVTVMNQLIDSGFNGKIITDLNITSVMSKIRGKGKGIYFVSLDFGSEISGSQSREFISKVNKEYGTEPTVFSTFAYVGMHLFSQVLGTGAFTKDEIKRNLLKIKDFPTPVGKISFDENGEISIPFVLNKISENGTIERVDFFSIK